MAANPPADILGKALSVARYERLLGVLRGLLAALLVASWGMLMLVAASALAAPAWARLAVLCISTAGGAAALLWAAARAVRPLQPGSVAVEVERAFPALRDRFVTSVEMVVAKPTWGPASTTSAALAAALAAEADQAVTGLDLRRAIDGRGVRRLGALAAATVLVLVASGVLFPQAWAELSATPGPAVQPVSPERAPGIPAVIGPAVADLVLSLRYPAYTGLPDETRTQDPDEVTVVAGTEATVKATVAGQQPVTTLHLAGGTRELAPDNEGRVTAEFRLTEDTTWSLQVTDAAGLRMATPTYRFKVTPDAPPTVSLREPGRSISIARPRPVRLAYRAQDDWGLGAVTLEWQAPGADGRQTVALSTGGGRELTGAWLWDLRPLRLTHGQGVEYRLVARDNDTVTGPKSARTRTYTISIGDEAQHPGSPPPAEEATAREAEGLEELEQEAEKLGEQLDELISQMQQGEMSGEERERKAAELAEAQRRVAEQADRVSRALQESERRMEADKRTPPELLDRMQELHDLLQEAMNEELAEALRELQEALETTTPQEQQQGVQRAQQLQQDFETHLQQAIELLKRLRLEQEIGRVADEAQRMSRDQSELNESRGAERLPQQAQEQDELRQREAQLESDLDELAQRAEELQHPSEGELSETGEQLEQSGAQASMQQAAEALRQSNPAQAAKAQQSAQQSLNDAAKRLGALQAEMRTQAEQQTGRALAELTRDSLYLSREQERVMDSTDDLETLNSRSAATDKARREAIRREQQALEAGTRQLGEKLRHLSSQNPSVDPKLALKAGETADVMAQAGREAAGGAGPQAAASQRDAMSRLNELAEDLLRLGESRQQGQQASGMQQLMQQLQGLAQQQRGLNQQTEQAQRREGANPERDGSQASLAEEQQRIREALAKMLERAGKPSGLPDQLGNVPGEMEDVEQELRGGRLGSETLTRQQDILHRMLDAQRSVYKKDQQRRRRVAERPEPFELPPSPPGLTPRRDPEAAPVVGPSENAELPLDYDDIVREYFRALARMQ